MNNTICYGSVRHRRYNGKKHQFQYSVFMMHLDLNQLDTVFKDYWLWSVDKPNIASFKTKKYLTKQSGRLKERIDKLIQEHGNTAVDQVFLLTNLNYFGYGFNPISLYFCHLKGKLTYVIAEVTNTPWGESHPYVLTAKEIKKNIYTMSFHKELHVSPFLTMDYEYRLNCKYTQDTIIVHISNLRNNKIDFDATLSLKQQPIDHRNLAKALIKHPLMTLKVIFAIHWQALKIWVKGNRFISKPRN